MRPAVKQEVSGGSLQDGRWINAGIDMHKPGAAICLTEDTP